MSTVPQRKLQVVVVFDDRSLGGTSRSAIGHARAWHAAGAQVVVAYEEGIASARSEYLRRIGIPCVERRELQGLGFDLVHLSHSAPTALLRSAIGDLETLILEHDALLLTTNVFARPLDWPKSIRSRVVESTLGDWAARQLDLQGRRSSRGAVVLPNPQDFSFFRPPSDSERRSARRRLGLADDQTVGLRVGSPHWDKWHDVYYRLIARLPVDKMILVGAPSELSTAVGGDARFIVLNRVSDDETIRSLYWASDEFLHAAKRGESFGNVLLEALGAGLPVRYLDRPYRDNTPREFHGMVGFRSLSRAESWMSVGSPLPLSGQTMRDNRSANKERLDRYSLPRLSATLQNGIELDATVWHSRDVASRVDRLRSSLERGYPRTTRVRGPDTLRIFLLHNGLVRRARDLRTATLRSVWS